MKFLVDNKVVKLFVSSRFAVLTSTALISSFAYSSDEGPKILKNHYSDVNWERVNAYKANFHCHSIKSDGRANPAELIYMYADAGYQILSITDHDNFYTTRRADEPDMMERYIHRDGNLQVPTSETTWPWTRWVDEEPSKIWVYGGIESSAFYPDIGEQGVLAVRGAELTTHPHIVSLFNWCGWPNRDQTDDERVACIEKHDGISYWAHPTHYVPGGPWENEFFDDVTWEEAVDYFGYYIVEYDGKLGFEMNWYPDHEGRRERDVEIFDRLLERYYREHDIFVMGSDDNHGTSVFEDATFTLVLADELGEESVRHALANGHKFVGSRTRSGTYPQFNSIKVDEEANRIILRINNYDRVRWIKDGEPYATGLSLDYVEMEDSIVRFEVEHDGEVFYSQAFYIK